MIRLTREIRFGVDLADDPIADSRNGHGGRPALTGFGSFLTLRVTVAGEPDPDSGYLLNIKLVDGVVRKTVVPALREAVLSRPPELPERALLRSAKLLQDAWLPVRFHGLELGLSPFLTYSWFDSEPLMIRLSQKFEFSASHRLHNPALSNAQNVELFGKCNNPHGHGHNYELQVTVAGKPDETSGQLMSVTDLEQIVDQHVLSALDHKHLNLEVPEFKALNPSVENIARVIFQRLSPALGSKLQKVTVWETPKTWAEFEG